jgi:flavin reductase (DIM6/NTAB) family NADH-FMN oxidoreductase RutF
MGKGKNIMKKSLGSQTLAMPTPVWLIGTYDSCGKPNIMTVAWGGIVCSEPPEVGVSLRKNRHSYEAIMLNKSFTVNIPSGEHVAAVDYVGMVSGKNYDKFKSASFTPVKSGLVNAPYISEFPLVLECKLVHTLELGAHTQFIGQILDVKADENVIGENGSPDASLVKSITYDPGSRNYFAAGAVLGKAFSIGKELMAGQS